jgi:hypothetical protein
MEYTWSQFNAFLKAADKAKRMEAATLLAMTATAQDGKAAKKTIDSLTKG